MARYGTFLYGGGATGATYGTAPVVTTLLWTFMVDWDGDGYYSGENEAVYMIDFSLSRGRDHLIAPNGQGFERYQAGKCSVTLDNTDGRFNPFNTSSPLYPYVTPGKSVRIAVKNGTAGTDYSLMRGKISDIQPYNTGNRKLVKIDVIDGQQFLRDRTVKIGLRQGDYPFETGDNINTTGFWVDLILQRANWPTDEWPIDDYDPLIDYSGQLIEGFTEKFFTQLHYAWFWNRDAMESIRELENVELGTFLHDRNGNAKFLSQHFTMDQITDIDEAEILTDIAIPQPWETLRNKIEVVVSPIELHIIDGIGGGFGTELLWKVGGIDSNAIPIAAESSVTFEAVFRWQNFNNIVPYGIFIDFDVDSLATGSGSDLTSQCEIIISEVGNGATISLLNNSATDGFIIDLSLYGQAIFAEFESLATTEDEDSINIYSTRVFKLQSPWMQAPDYAQTIADFLLENLKDPTPYPVIKIEQRPSLQFPLDLYIDVIHLVASTLSINKLYRIGKISHDWLNNNGQSVLTILKLEPYYAVGASSEINNLLSPFDSAVEVDGTTPPVAERMLWTLDDTWEYGTGEGNPTGSLRHYLVNPAGFLNKSAITSPVGHTVEAGERFDFDYIWIPGAGFGTIGGTDLIRVEVYIGASLRVNQTYSPGNYNVWQTATFDLSEWAGEVLTSIEFIRAAGAGVGIADQRILFDNVFIGR